MNTEDNTSLVQAPKWAIEGTRVQVKNTPVLRKYGIIYGSSWKAYPGEKGTLSFDGDYWRVHFDDVAGSPRNRKMLILSESEFDELRPIRIKTK